MRAGKKVEVVWTKGKVRLNGNYAFSLELTKGEITALFTAAFGDVSLADIAKILPKNTPRTAKHHSGRG